MRAPQREQRAGNVSRCLDNCSGFVLSGRAPASGFKGPGCKPTKQNLTREQAATYQAAFEAVLAVPISTGIGYWVDQEFETAPVGLGIGAVIGFAAMVLRLVRMRPSESGSDAERDDDEDDGASSTKT